MLLVELAYMGVRTPIIRFSLKLRDAMVSQVARHIGRLVEDTSMKAWSTWNRGLQKAILRSIAATEHGRLAASTVLSFCPHARSYFRLLWG